MPCENQKFVGKDVVMEFVIGCGDVLPTEGEWQRFGSMRTKEFNLEWETTDATADDSVGALRENLATFQTLSISGDGVVKVAGVGSEALKELVKHVANPQATSGQPVIWVRMTFPDLTFTAFMIATSASRSAPFDDVVTYSFEASATASDFGLIVEDTPSPTSADPVSLEAFPATLTLTVGQNFKAQGVVSPVDAPQTLRFTSDTPSVATVGQINGEITAVAAGTANITVASSIDAGVFDTIVVTSQPIVLGITVEPTTVAIAETETEQLVPTVSPAGADDSVTYLSNNPAIATVSGSGLVTGVSEGTTSVKVTSVSRPSISYTVPVEVTVA